MKIGLIGLGRMGFNLALNAIDHRQEIVAFDISHKEIQKITAAGVIPAFSLKELVDQLPSKKIVWIMIPAGSSVDEVLDQLVQYLGSGSIIIDGGNSFYKDSQKRQKALLERGITFMDVGTSGGIEGARRGACMMIGGDFNIFQVIEPFVKAVCVENGYGYMGESGAGHFVKMVHNGIEYGMMQAIGEGFDILAQAPFQLDLKRVNRVFRHGSVIRSWLIDLLEKELEQDLTLGKYTGQVSASGEGQWALEEAGRMNIRVPVLEASVHARTYSHTHPTFGSKVLSALRNGFGGHKELVKS